MQALQNPGTGLNRLARLCALACLTLVLSSCALLRSPPATPVSQAQHDSALLQMRCWELAAKIGIRTYDTAESARVDWEQQEQTYRMVISGPLGIGAVRINGDDERVTMHTERNRMLIARTPEALIEQELGWNLPVSNLYHWVRGLPVPGHGIDAEQRSPEGLIRHLEQDGWLIDIERHAHVTGLFLPERMTLTHPDIQVRLIIKEWITGTCSG